MSKLAALVAIPLGLLALKRLQKEFPDDPTAKPIGFTLGPAANGDFTAFFPETLPSTIGAVEGPTSGITAPGSTVPLGGGQVWTLIFPDTAAGAAEEFAAKQPFEFGLFPALDLSGIGQDTFTSGFFDPEFQKQFQFTGFQE